MQSRRHNGPCRPPPRARRYWAINAGSVFSYILTPLVRVHAGYAPAFCSTAGVLALAILVFLAPSRSYLVRPPAGVSVYAAIMRVLCARRSVRGYVVTSKSSYGAISYSSGGEGGRSVESTPLIGAPPAPPPAQDAGDGFAKPAARGAMEPLGVEVPPPRRRRGGASSGCCSLAGILDAARDAGLPDDEVDGVGDFLRIIPLFSMLPGARACWVEGSAAV